MAATLYLTQASYDRILAALRAVYPQEGCGFCSGRGGCITTIYPITNTLDSPVAYAMDPQEQIAALLAMEAAGETLLAIYHSHPHGPAGPSPSDIAHAYYPEAGYIIVSFARPEQPLMQAFSIVENSVQPIRLVSV
ncbi:MAG: M67 family metallopeptidase [Ardenticatenaceae bacterium]|nr:M67 family metallopeptidase [Anaerolineales bacterium]MCB8918556.1 M67 family metallopeptidase [Ardenticatenaceae bacterium]